MPVPRIHCEQKLGPGAQFPLAAQAAQHVARSLRLAPGADLILFDGLGGEYHATIERIDRDRVDVKVGAWRDLEREPPFAIGLVQGLPEADKMDLIVQKATELGVAWIQPVVSERSVVRLSGERAQRREAHWRRVAIAACEQCGRNRVPAVRPVLAFANWLGAADAIPRFVLHAAGEPLAAGGAAPAAFEILIGPEGGLSQRERTLAIERGCRPVSLGPRILRTETASLAALAAIHALWGDFRPLAGPGFRG